MINLGTQHICDMFGLKADSLKNAEQLEKWLIEGLEYADLKFVKVIAHRFVPDGLTLLAVISESHIGVHTYPEFDAITFDIYTCTSGEKHRLFLKFFETKLEAKTVRLTVIDRTKHEIQEFRNSQI